jgi:hypothetical protein
VQGQAADQGGEDPAEGDQEKSIPMGEGNDNTSREEEDDRRHQHDSGHGVEEKTYSLQFAIVQGEGYREEHECADDDEQDGYSSQKRSNMHDASR